MNSVENLMNEKFSLHVTRKNTNENVGQAYTKFKFDAND